MTNKSNIIFVPWKISGWLWETNPLTGVIFATSPIDESSSVLRQACLRIPKPIHAHHPLQPIDLLVVRLLTVWQLSLPCRLVQTQRDHHLLENSVPAAASRNLGAALRTLHPEVTGPVGVFAALPAVDVALGALKNGHADVIADWALGHLLHR